MFVEAFFLACLTVAANAGAVSVSLGGLASLDGGIGLGGGIGIGSIGIAHAPVVATAPIVTKSIDYVTPPKYAFKYGVLDQHTGDNKQQAEERIGDVVRGEYSLAEPDGTIRVVKYTADKINGFNAVVSRIGKAIQPSGIIAKSIGLSNGAIGIGGGGLGYY